MFNCHCQDTMGKWIRISKHKKLWICDSCKGCREVVVKLHVVLSTAYNPRLAAIFRYKARVAER